jgi:hypothetical protein
MKLEDLINSSDMSQLHKNVSLGFVARAKENEEGRRKIRDLVEEIANEKNLDEIILSTEEVIIYTIRPRIKGDEWDMKYPFRSIYFNGEKWCRVHIVSSSLDEAMLTYLGEKYQGGNSQFAGFALKMLEIKTED